MNLTYPNKNERSRELTRFIFAASLLLCEAAIFYFIWRVFYNPALRVSYHNKGNYFVTLIYAVLILIFGSVYGMNKLGDYAPSSMFLGLSVTALVTNIVSYFAVIIPAATWYLSPVPAVVYMTLIDMAAALLWILVGNRVYFRLFPAEDLILISNSAGTEIAAKFALRKERYRICEVINVTGGETPFEQICAACSRYGAVVIGDLESVLRNDLLKYCYAKRIRTYSLPKLSDIILRSGETLHVFDTPLILNRNQGLSPVPEAAKRGFDILLSGLGLLILSPLFLVIAILIKAEDGGPVFFLQERCTKNARVFRIIKFRSMIQDAEKLEGGDMPAMEHDPRITRIGAFIRRCRIDELPQLINIFIGDMSIVGPRPEKKEHVEKFCGEIPEYAYRFMVRGGLTGYAQVYGKYNTTAYDKLRLDLMYIGSCSFLLDIQILLKTLQIVLTRESTESFSPEEAEKLRSDKGSDGGAG